MSLYSIERMIIEKNYAFQPIMKSRFIDKLLESLCHFTTDKKPKSLLNNNIDDSYSDLAASIFYSLEHTQLNLSREYKMKNPKYINKYCKRIAELKEEYQNTIDSMLKEKLFAFDDKERRCIFRRLNNTKEYEKMFKFIELFNDWTLKTVEYLILSARKKHDDEKFKVLIDKTLDTSKQKMLISARQNVGDEYDKDLNQLTQLLSDYTDDLHSLAVYLNNEYNILNQLEVFQSEEEIITRT